MKGRAPTSAEKRYHDNLVEEWRAVPGYGERYEVSSLGMVRRKEIELQKRTRYGGVMTQTYPAKMLKLQDRKGYHYARIGVYGKKYQVPVHRMVLAAFHRPQGEGEICRHLDGNPKNNRPCNLAWGTHQENMNDRKAHGNYLTHESHVMAKLTPEDVELIRTSDMTGTALSKMLGIGQSQVSRIRRNQSWVEEA